MELVKGWRNLGGWVVIWVAGGPGPGPGPLARSSLVFRRFASNALRVVKFSFRPVR